MTGRNFVGKVISCDLRKRLRVLDRIDGMRIISGRFRRRTLHVNTGQTTRPITDRAKVILFDNIQSSIPGRRVLDLFCGTGSMGLEALSRGAANCVFIEQDHRAYELLCKNIDEIGARELSLPWRISALQSSLKPKGDQWCPYGLIFFDPPYPMLKDLRPGSPLFRAIARLARPDISEANALLVLRSPTDMNLKIPAVWNISSELTVGSMHIRFLRKNPEAIEAEAGDSATDDAEHGESEAEQ